MTDHIEREAAEELISQPITMSLCLTREECLAKRSQRDIDVAILHSIPAADVRPVRMGKWIDHQEGRWIYAKCSECETVHDVRSNFCPNCGCAMEET